MLISKLQHYVYLFRDKTGKPRYVGYGQDSKRAMQHLNKSHNINLTALVQDSGFTLEIAGPFENKDTALAIETTLISALQPECNISRGQARWRFRSMGVPDAFAKRFTQEPLAREDFLCLCKEQSRPLLFVKIGSKDFKDGRAPYDPAHPPKDEKIVERMDRWWQLGHLVREWIEKPGSGPATLIGIYGKPGAQVIIGALQINPQGWVLKETVSDYVVPVLPTTNLDALGLRGRRISGAANLKFGQFAHQMFILLKSDGTIVGGNPTSR